MASGHTHQTDVVIVGAGPVGLFAVFECGMVRLRCHVIDVLDDAGGQCTALYPEKPIYDIPGFPRIEAAELVVRLKAQAAPFRPVYHLGEQVQGLETLSGGFWKVTTSKGTVVQARAVIIAAGVGAFGPNRPPLPGIEAYEGKSVFYYVTQREAFRGKRVVIAGGGDTAVDWALSLAEIADRVSVIHRRDRFRAAPESEAQLKALAKSGKLDLVVPYQLHGLEGAAGQLTAVTVATLDGAHQADRGRYAAAVLRPVDVAGADRRLAARAGAQSDRHRRLDGRDQQARHLRHRRCRHLSRQAEADPDRLRRSGHRRALGLCAGPSRDAAALRVFDDVGIADGDATPLQWRVMRWSSSSITSPRSDASDGPRRGLQSAVAHFEIALRALLRVRFCAARSGDATGVARPQR